MLQATASLTLLQHFNRYGKIQAQPERQRRSAIFISIKMDETERRALQENHELIVKNVSVTESKVLVKLVQSGTISDTEYEDVRGEYFSMDYGNTTRIIESINGKLKRANRTKNSNVLFSSV